MNGYWMSNDAETPTHPLEPLNPVPPPPADPAQPPVGLGVMHYCYTTLKPGYNGLHFASDLTTAIRLGHGPICWSVNMPDQTVLALDTSPAAWGCANQRRYMVRKDFLQALINALLVIRASVDPVNSFHVRAVNEITLSQVALGLGDRTLAWTLAQAALIDIMASNTHRIHPGTDWVSVETALQAAWVLAP